MKDRSGDYANSHNRTKYFFFNFSKVEKEEMSNLNYWPLNHKWWEFLFFRFRKLHEQYCLGSYSNEAVHHLIRSYSPFFGAKSIILVNAMPIFINFLIFWNHPNIRNDLL